MNSQLLMIRAIISMFDLRPKAAAGWIVCALFNMRAVFSSIYLGLNVHFSSCLLLLVWPELNSVLAKTPQTDSDPDEGEFKQNWNNSPSILHKIYIVWLDKLHFFTFLQILNWFKIHSYGQHGYSFKFAKEIRGEICSGALVRTNVQPRSFGCVSDYKPSKLPAGSCGQPW